MLNKRSQSQKKNDCMIPIIQKSRIGKSIETERLVVKLKYGEWEQGM